MLDPDSERPAAHISQPVLPVTPYRAALLAALGLAAWPAGAWEITSNLTVRAEATVREGYDSNVYLQDVEPNRTLVPKAVQPFKDSFITSLTPAIYGDYKPCDEFNFSAGYAPTAAFYYSTPSENHVANRILGNMGGKISDVPWELNNSLNVIVGQDEGLYYGGPPEVGGNAPAIGGIPVRDRRNATVYRGLFRTTWTQGKFFLRPVGSAYVHNFHTAQKDARFGQPDYGYENYVDRNEFAGGIDAGMEVVENLRVYALYRYGIEGEGTMVGSPYSYSQIYNRPGGGIEGQPLPWLKLGLALGADMHQTISDNVAPGFEMDYTKLWGDVAISFLPTKDDTITFKFARNTQPAFSSPSVYDDTSYDILGKHVFGKHWAAGAGFRLNNGDWFYPVFRNDWIYTASASLAYTHNAHLSTELTYSYDWTDTKIPQIPDTSGREFTRNLVWLGVKYAF